MNFQRYRLSDRDPNVVFLDKVTESVTAQWAREKHERAVNKCGQKVNTA